MQLLNLTDCTLNYYWQADTCGRQKPRGFKVAVSKLTGKRSEIKGRDSCQDFKLYVTRCAAARRTCVYFSWWTMRLLTGWVAQGSSNYLDFYRFQSILELGLREFCPHLKASANKEIVA